MASVEEIINKFDRIIARSEKQTIDRINAALETACRQLESELLKSYAHHAGNTSLLPSQRKLLILNEVSQLLQLINPSNAAVIDRQLQELLAVSSQNGLTLADELTKAIANESLQSFASVNLAAIAAQARDGMKRLSRHSEEFASRASAIVEMHLATGSGVQKVARSLRAQLGVTKGRAIAIARTESISALDTATRTRYKESGIDMVIRVGTQDDRICGYCISRIGNVYPVDKAPAAIHPMDRCYNAPFKSEWLNLGLIDLEWYKKQKEDAISRSEDTPRSGVAPFEKYAGMTEPVKPIYTLNSLLNTRKT